MTEYTEDKIIRLIDSAIADKSETTDVEFKDARGGLPGDTWRTISSFSHKPGGGIIVFGVKEESDGNISVVNGLDIATLQEKISELLNTVMQNAGRPDYKIIDYQGKRLLILVVYAIPDELKPCFNKRMGLPTGACIRDGNTDRAITFEEMKAFVRNSQVYKYDRKPVLNFETSLLSKEKLEVFLAKSAERAHRPTADNTPNDQLLVNLGLAKREGLYFYPTVGGILVFSTTPPQQIADFARIVVRCVKYAGLDVASPIVDKVDIVGTLDEQIDEMERFILRNIAVNAEIVGAKRVETFEYPRKALRELVANAVIHRDYMITETYTQVNIFADRIEISNPGNLPPGVTIENIKEAQFSRNEVIAAILRDLEYLEEYGRGIDIVFSEMASAGLLPPMFKNQSNSFSVTLLGGKYRGLNSRQTQIMHRIFEMGRVSAGELEKTMRSVSRPTINSDLAKLVEIGLIEQKGSSRSTYYELKR